MAFLSDDSGRVRLSLCIETAADAAAYTGPQNFRVRDESSAAPKVNEMISGHVARDR